MNEPHFRNEDDWRELWRRNHAPSMKDTNLVGYGLSNKEIADRLSLSTSCVEMHVEEMIERLCVHNRWQAVRAALKAGIPVADLQIFRRES